MGLPTSRNTNYSPGSPVYSADLNDIQDQIIALYNGAHGDRELQVLPGSGLVFAGTASVALIQVNLLADVDEVYFPLLLVAGQRIKAVAVNVVSNSSGHQVDLDVFAHPTNLGNANISTTGELAVTGISHSVASGEHLYARVQRNGAGGSAVGINQIRVTFDKP